MVLRLLGKFWPSREADIAVVPEWREREGKHVLLASWVDLGEIQRREREEELQCGERYDWPRTAQCSLLMQHRRGDCRALDDRSDNCRKN